MQLPFENTNRSILVRQESQTNPSYGRAPELVPTEELIKSGIIVLNKPKGPTSHQVAEWVRNIVGADKAGQAGTLDPAVTGLLPIALGKSTGLLGVLLSAGKEYVCSMHIHGDIAPEKIREVMLNQFVGRIKQLPPVKSAVKRDWRIRKIYYIDILEIEGREVLFRVGCQAGTYIRKLCFDIGQALGCGAHMAQLVRTKSAGFRWEERVTLQDLTDAMHYYQQGNDEQIRKCILPIETLVRHLPKVWVIDEAIPRITQGMQLKAAWIAKMETGIKPNDEVAVLSLKEELVLIGNASLSSEQMLTAQQMAVKTLRVAMEPTRYRK